MNKKLFILSFFVLFMFFMYPIFVFKSVNKYNVINFFLYVISFVLISSYILSILIRNLKSYNIFIVSYFTALFFNTLNISSKQLLKTSEDVYFFLVGPFVFYLLLYLFENVRNKKIKIKPLFRVNVNTFYFILLVAYIVLKLYIGTKVGFKIMNFSSLSDNKFTLPGVSGLSAIIQWLLIIFIPYAKKKYSVIAVISIIIFSGILQVKRGDIIRIFLFLLLLYVFLSLKMHTFTKKKIILLLLGTSSLAFIFIIFGEYRMHLRGGVSGLIIEFLGSRINSISIAWIYSYFAFNFEVLKLYYNIPPSYEMIHIMSALRGGGGGDLNISISGFNASTFLGPFVLDYGYFYFLEIFVFSIITGLLIYFSKKLDFIGLYVFILTFIALMIFGEYILNRSIFVSIICALLIFPYINIQKSISLKKG